MPILSDPDAERELLGAMLLYPPALISPVMAALRSDHFAGPRHGEIYNAICDILRTGEPPGVVVLMARLREAYGWQPADAHDLVAAVSGAGMSSQVPGLARVVEGLYRRRSSLHQLSSAAAAAESGTDEDFEAAVQRVVDVATPRAMRDRTPRLGDDMIENPDDYIGRWGEASPLAGISTGVSGLDRLTMGWQPGNLVVVAARPAVGKTAFAVQAAIEATRAGGGVLFASLEMTRHEIHRRISAHVAGLDSTVLTLGGLRDDILARATNSQAEVAGLGLYVEDRFSNPLEIHEEAAILGNKISMVIIDYIGLLQPVGRFGSREQEVSWLSRTCKKMAAELRKPVLLLSQLSRAMKGNESKRPILSDLRDSGAIESDANVVIFLHDAGRLGGKPGEEEHVELIVSKQRNGPIGITDVRYRRETGHFTNWP